MDDSFARLEDISVEHTLERLESIFDSSALTFSRLTSPTELNEPGHQVSAALDHQDVFNPNGVFGIQSQVSTVSTSGSLVRTITQPHKMPPSTTSQVLFATKSLPSPVIGNATSNSQQGGLILSAQPVATMSGTVLTASSIPSIIQTSSFQPQVVQVALQPVASPNMNTTVTQQQTTLVGKSQSQMMQGKQPQLLPKPQTQMQQQQTRLLTSSGSQLVLNAGNVLTSLPGVQATPSNASVILGQMVGSAASAGSTPLVIQQPGANPFIVLRPSSATQTLLPVVSQPSTSGTLLLQSPGNGQVTHAQPQVKIITPQGRMQMQQIQTPTGPKLIAVPVGGSSAIQLNTNNQYQPLSGLQLTTLSLQQAGQGATLSVQPGSQTITLQQGNTPMTVQPVSLQQAVPTSFVTVTTTSASTLAESIFDSKKKSWKSKKNDEEDQPKVAKGLDLGELMKDVGLDLEGFEDPSSSQLLGSVDTSQDSSQVLISQVYDTPAVGQTGAQLVAQIQQPVPLQPAVGGQLQLVQGPDGQYVLQSTGILQPQVSQPSSHQNPLAQNISSISTLNSLSHVQQQPAGQVLSTSVGLNQSSTVTLTTSTSVSTPLAANSVCATPPSKVVRTPRNITDQNRTPLLVDERLPPGWHRKVSQRKSGASAGRYEVFIISPVGKRFRSRNELRAFFEKTQEKDLTPEDFDFSTFGTGTTLGRFGNKETTAPPPVTSTPSSVHTDYSPGLESPGMTSVSATRVPSTPVQATQNLLSSLQEPLPATAILTPSPPLEHSTIYNSQLSLETAEADAQISQLLESLQKDRNKKLSGNDAEKMVDLIHSLTGDEGSLDSRTSSPKFSRDTSALTTKESFNLSGVFSTSSDSEILSSPTIQTNTSLSDNRTQNLLSVLSPSHQEQTVTNVSTPVTLGGGAASQMRAYQNLPPNTRIVRGPNGQLSLQKVQTIELTPELQANLKLVQSQIHEIESLPVRSAKDESLLAQLQVRQQQILASGKPVQSPAGQILPGIPVSSISQQISLSTATNVVSSFTSSPYLASNLASQPKPPVTTVGGQPVQPIPYGQEGSLSSNVSSPAASVKVASGASIPHLTEEQKKIVAEFKQKLAELPPEHHSQFIATHKANLIRQLNLQPTQLQLLRTNSLQSTQPVASKPIPVATTVSTPRVTTTSTSSLPAGPVRTVFSNTRQKPLPLGAGTIRGGIPSVQQQNLSSVQPSSSNHQQINTQPSTYVDTDYHSSVFSSGSKKPGEPYQVTVNKQKKVAWVESQVKKDQHEAVNPNFRTPFRNKEDACKRLLRYHVFNELDSSPWDLDKSDENFEIKSAVLIARYRSMLAKYHLLLLQESTRLASSSEEVMLARFWDSEERQALASDKDEAQKGAVIEMPPLPAEWAEKYEELYSSKPPDGIKAEPKEELRADDLDERLVKEEVDGGDKDRKRSFDEVTIKDEDESDLSQKWLKRQKLEAYDEFEAIRHDITRYGPTHVDDVKLSKLGVKASTGLSDSDSDEEFSLRDVDPSKAVGSILEADDDGEDDVGLHPHESMFGNENDPDSVQHAINSILDTLPQTDRIHTPDFTGLLDSIDDDAVSESDPATEAAVNSIPHF